MNKLKLGSSETTRETVITKFNFIDYIQLGKPNHILNPDINFLEWFIGFFEAEGSFCHWFDGKKDSFQIKITKNDPQLMYKIKKNLGFGNVTQFIKNNKFYWRYSTSKKKYLISLIYLFNGNLLSNHKQKHFKDFVTHFNKMYNLNFSVFETRLKPSLKTAWLSGFLEGDGGFYFNSNNIIRFNKNGYKRYNLKMKFYITQKNEIELLMKIKELFYIPTNIYKIHNGNEFQKYNRLETSQLNCHLLIIKYLENYPFLGKRNITFSRWKRLVNYRVNKYPITDKSILKLKRLILSTQNN